MSETSGAAAHPQLLKIVAEELVRPSFARCCEHGPEIFDTFYAALADRLPGVGAMFANTDMRKQNELIRGGIATLIDHAAGSPAAVTELQRLAGLHDRRHLNVTPAMYDGWTDALMEMVAEFDSQRTDNLEVAWREVVSFGVGLMITRH